MSLIYEQVIRPEDKAVIISLPSAIRDRFYMAGGTGLALQLGHRCSYDFDLFAQELFDAERLWRELQILGPLELLQQAGGTLEVTLRQTRLSMFHYPYPVLQWGPVWAGLRLASTLDIALMKLMAIAARGSRKDFVDLYFVSQRIDLETLFENLSRKYIDRGYNLYHLIKSLGYFEDARKEPMPKMIADCDWAQVEDFFCNKQTKLAERFL